MGCGCGLSIGAGRWCQDNAPVESVDVLWCRDVSAVEADDRDMVMGQVIDEVHASFDLMHGPLLRAVLFDVGAAGRSVLFVAVHHLVVDGVSWRILLEDLDTAYRQAGAVVGGSGWGRGRRRLGIGRCG